MMRSAVVLAAVLASSAAPADESEATLTLEGGPGFISVADVNDPSTTTMATGASGSVQLAYGISDLLAVDAGLGGAFVYTAEYPDQMTPLGNGNTLHHVRALRALVGATARFGASVIPTAGLHLGYQHRWLTDAALFDDQSFLLERFPDRSTNELLATASVGLEVRLNRHWLVGAVVQGAVAVGPHNGFASIEVPVRLSYTFYPGWFRSMRVMRFDE